MVAPKLRFKEFEGDWSSQTLGNIAKFISGYAFDSEKFDENGRKLITPKNFTTYGRALFTEQNTKFTIESCDEKFVCRGNDLLILLTDLTQSCELLGKPILLPDLNEEILLNQRILKVEPNQDVIGKLFLLNFFLTENYLKHIKETSTGTTVRHSSHKILSKYEVFYPSKAEQTKIASFLSAVDEKISQLTQKHALLSQYKQGMMQKLFSQQIRFKADDGSEFGEWEETSLHTFLCESLIKGSKGNKAKKLTVKLWGKGVIPKNEAFQGSENTQYYKRSAGQLIYGKLDFLNCAFGLIPEYLDGFESTIDAPAFDIDNKIVHPYFLINRFLQKDFYQKNGEEADGSRKAKRINQSVFLAMQIDLPCLEEQTKIANFLSAIDQKIEVVAQQIEQAKQWKKGLLQQMFV